MMVLRAYIEQQKLTEFFAILSLRLLLINRNAEPQNAQRLHLILQDTDCTDKSAFVKIAQTAAGQARIIFLF